MRQTCFLLAALLGCDPAPQPLAIHAASSLKELVTEVAGEWAKKTGRPVRFQFEASSTLARQLKEGAAADLFISASPEWLDEVRPRERLDWLSNRLVLVVRKEAKDPDLKGLESLSLVNEQAPAGKYARAALAHLKIALPGRVLMGANVRDVLSKVSQGGAQAGIVYATDAAVDPEVRIAFTFPAESHPKILYSAGLLTPAGKPFFDALREPWTLESARRHGFTRP